MHTSVGGHGTYPRISQIEKFEVSAVTGVLRTRKTLADRPLADTIHTTDTGNICMGLAVRSAARVEGVRAEVTRCVFECDEGTYTRG